MAWLIWIVAAARALAGVVLVPGAPIIGDGATVSTVRLYVDGLDEKSRVRVRSESGKVGQAVPGNDGIVVFPFTAPTVGKPGTVPVKATVDGVESVIEIPVVPRSSGSLDLRFEPPTLTASSPAQVRITAAGPSSARGEGRRILLSTSLGTVDAPVPDGEGGWLARYTPPKTVAGPGFVTFVASDAAEPGVVGWAAAPMSVRRAMTLDAPAGAQVMLAIGGKTFGPKPADAKGKAALDVELDPRQTTGRMSWVNPDSSKGDKDLPLPPLAGKGQILLLTVPATVPADPSLTTVLRAVAIGPDGRTQPASGIKLSVSGGILGSQGPDGETLKTEWTFPVKAGPVTVRAEGYGLTAERVVKALGAFPQVTLVATPEELSPTGTSVKIVARLKDPQGAAIIGRTPGLVGESATLAGPARDNKDGSYGTSATVPSKAPVARIHAQPPLDPSGLGVASILAWPASPAIRANGIDATTVTLVTVDRWAYPVPGVELRLSVPRGDGSVPATVKTDARGMARVTFKAGKTEGMSGVRAEAAGFVGEAPVFQRVAVLAAPPPGGSPEYDAVLARWRQAAPTLTIERQGAAPAAGPPTAIQLTTIPPYTTPGAAILVQVRVTDAAGMGVRGLKPVISVSPGTAGELTDNRDGTYAFPLQLPAGVDGPVSIAVSIGGASSSLQLPTLADADRAPARTTSTGPATTAATAAQTGGGRRPSSGPPRGEAALYLLDAFDTFEQSASGDAGLIEETGFEPADAGFLGAGLDAAFAFLDEPWGRIGVEGRARFTVENISVGDNDFRNYSRDLVAGARYLYPLADGAVGVGGSVGVHTTSGIAFRYPDQLRQEAEAVAAPVTGARVAGMARYDGAIVSAAFEAAETFAPGPVVTHVEARGSVVVHEPFTVHAGALWDLRAYTLEDTEADGDVDTKQSGFGFLVGGGVVFR